SGEGVIGRNYSYQVTSSVDAYFDNKIFNPFIASGSIGMCIDEFNGDNFDHGPHGFVGGGYLGAVQTNGRPLQSTRVPKGTPRWGLEWKQAVAKNYLTEILQMNPKPASMFAFLQDRREVLTATSTSDNPNAWSRV